jgi:hypothetical protein
MKTLAGLLALTLILFGVCVSVEAAATPKETLAFEKEINRAQREANVIINKARADFYASVLPNVDGALVSTIHKELDALKAKGDEIAEKYFIQGMSLVDEIEALKAAGDVKLQLLRMSADESIDAAVAGTIAKIESVEASVANKFSTYEEQILATGNTAAGDLRVIQPIMQTLYLSGPALLEKVASLGLQTVEIRELDGTAKSIERNIDGSYKQTPIDWRLPGGGVIFPCRECGIVPHF